MINVTKTFLPPFEEYTQVLKRAWDKAWITNNGELVRELEEKLKEYLGVKHLFFTNNGTIVLQMAFKAFNITKEVITTPFSYVATTNSILWEGCKPVFADIDPVTFCIDPEKIESAITADTQAILATHVYGVPCNVDAIASIGSKHNIPVIYDGAHAFGTEYKSRHLLSYGDISTCSFHATKLFHTVEGGCIITDNDEIARKLMLYRQFGHIGDEYFSIGINGKNSEFHAAMGLCNLPRVSDFIVQREKLYKQYKEQLANLPITFPAIPQDIVYNYAYCPVLFEQEGVLLKAKAAFEKEGIYTRRYFYPSLNKLSYIDTADSCPVSEDISARVLCLPFSQLYSNNEIGYICSVLKSQF